MRDVSRRCVLVLMGMLVTGFGASAAERWGEWSSVQEGFTPLFDGESLAGWTIVNGAASTWSVRDGMVVTTGHPHGVLRSDRQYENFILELEYRHTEEQGNAGLFVWSDPLPARGAPFTRSLEVQILDGRNTENYTSHGDIFSIWGASMTPERPHPNGWSRALPTERRAKPAGEWNHYRVICYDGQIKLAVNGEIVTEAHSAVPRKGYICLEAEGAETHFRNIRIRELPSTDPEAHEIADEARGFRNLYNGIDLTGWRHEEGHLGHWKPEGWVLSYDGASEASDPHLWTEEEFGDFVLIVDWRWPDGEVGDSGIYLRGTNRAQANIWGSELGSGEVHRYRVDASLPEEVREAVTPSHKADNPPGEWNRFVITMEGDRLTVVLNGETVIEHAQLPGVPERGPIALQHHGDAVDFANIYILKLD